MSPYKFNFRIGKLHITVSVERKLAFSINNYHTWFGRPIVRLYEWRLSGASIGIASIGCDSLECKSSQGMGKKGS